MFEIMDEDNSLNIRNWGYYEPTPVRGNLGLQLMSPTMSEKPILGSRSAAIMTSMNEGFYHRDIGISQPLMPMEYVRDAWIGQREKLLNVLPGNHDYAAVLPETSSSHHMEMFQPPYSTKDEPLELVEEAGVVEKVSVPNKKRQRHKGPKSPRAKKGTGGAQVPKPEGSPPTQRARAAKKSAEIMINGINMDISVIPIPVCSCTGNPQQCYRWGCGGWQSACCTTCISVYPLPMSTKRRSARIAGRKMSLGAFKKVLEKLAGEGYDFSNPIDLRTHWAKHGTNKFVTIR
ncbi:protein BASIC PENTACYSTEINE2-like [Populus alba x Populus x berolinensis]|nr:protein BASIC PENTACYSTEINE2-like [Populus alba x Populus x berolinensis]